MKDIYAQAAGLDAGVADTQVFRAKNILNVQLGSLEYAPDLGIDLEYFLSEDFQFQNESFKAYLIQVLASYSINVASITDVVEALFREYTFNLSPSASEGGLIAR
jgi:hypothetical protein